MKTKENKSGTFMNKRLVAILGTAGILLLVPLVAMLFTDEVDWGLADFMIAGILLFGTGLSCELAMRKVKKTEYRIAICFAILIMFLLVWADLAVGIFNIPGFSGS